jgi:hypothetical protein
MGTSKKNFTDAAKLTPLKIQEQIANQLFDDSADEKWVNETLAYVEANEDKFESQDGLKGTINDLLFKAVCSDADKAIETIITKYPDKIEKDFVGHLFWAAASHSNIKAMQLITAQLGRENISEADVEEALSRAAHKGSPKLIDYLAENHADKITTKAIRNCFASTGNFAATNNMDKFVKLWGNVIRPEDIDKALKRTSIQRQYCEDRFDYNSAVIFLEQTKATLLQSIQVKNKKLEP